MSKRVNVEQAMKNLKGVELKQDDGSGTEEVLTLKSVLVNSILHPRNEDEKTSGEQKCARYALSQAIWGADGEVTIGNSDIALIKKLVTAVNPAMIVGQVYEMLDDAVNAD